MSQTLIGCFEIVRVGTKYHHPIDFTIDRPHGSGDYIFIRFLNQVTVKIFGENHIAQAENCVFFSPRCNHRLMAYKNQGLGNDWMHFKGSNIKKFLLGHNLPLNKIITTTNITFVREIINNVKAEINESEMLYSRRMKEIFFEKLCINLSRSLSSKNLLKLSSSKKEHLEAFRKLRQYMLETFTKDWNVEEMAQNVYMSSSRFANLYKEFFNTSPISELLRERIEHAKWLLTSTTLSINEVAKQSGFKNFYYFSRKFNEYVGCPPSKYHIAYIKK